MLTVWTKNIGFVQCTCNNICCSFTVGRMYNVLLSFAARREPTLAKLEVAAVLNPRFNSDQCTFSPGTEKSYPKLL